MLVLTCEIKIVTAKGTLVFNYVNDVSIESGWKAMTDRCVIKLPRNLKWKDNTLNKLLSVGDKVRVRLGYNGELQTEFEGYLMGIKPTTPIELTCEDEFYQLKRKQYKIAFGVTTLEKVVKSFYSGTIDVYDMPISGFRINNETGAQVLERIKKDYGLHSFFRRGVLHVGTVYVPDAAVSHKWHFQRNIISNSLEYKNAMDQKIKLTVISLLPDNTKVEVPVGDSDGDERTLHQYNITDKAKLKEIGESELLKMRYDGYSGKFVSFGIYDVVHGDIAVLSDNDDILKREGSYLIDSVKTTFGVGGYRREIEIGRKV